MSNVLWSYDDLATRWQAPRDEDDTARSRWVRRRCKRLGLRPLPAFGRGKDARFRPDQVLRCEEKNEPRRR